MKQLLLILSLATMLLGQAAYAQGGDAEGGPAKESTDEAKKFRTRELITGLDNPWGIVVRPLRTAPGQFELFVAESGAGRVVRVATQQPDQLQPAIERFPVAASDAWAPLELGPLGLVWITPNRLGVAQAQSLEVRIYAVAQPSETLKFSDQEYAARRIATSAGSGGVGILALTASETAAYFATTSTDTPLLRGEILANRLQRLQPVGNKIDAQRGVTGLAVTPSNRPPFLVASHEGDVGSRRDSRLVFFTIDTAENVLSLETGLHDMMALAYSPSGKLYVVDPAWDVPQEGGIYRLDAVRRQRRQACRAVKIASLPRPVGLSFASGTTLFVTCLGDGQGTKRGSVVRIDGAF